MRSEPFDRSLHVKVVKLFSKQLKLDKALLDSVKRKNLKKLSLAAKWAPTFGEFHDKHTFLLSSIAESLFPDPALYCPWGMNTNIVAVFENLLKQAKASNVSQDKMVKQTFVFSGMQFDQGMDQEVWTSSFDRIKTSYADAGYDMPKLTFWNLAGATNKPVAVYDRNTALVWGYSHDILKAFLETGALESVEEIVEQAVDGADGMIEVKKVGKITH